ncbi:hypothetical protein K502DRAFT_325634 [Neoconidiobolus thromboides FSU 785]|nr:hypothetical protein K502DRAFT_325634 [Neoconidiobolus thromboides FSU 785]
MVSLNFSLSLLLLGAVHQVVSHMEMSYPPPRRSKHNKNYAESQFDYSYTAPLGPEFPYPCRGYGKGPSSYDAQAGQSIPVTLDGGANHNGGHCQFALSFNDKDFVVVKTVMGTCMLDSLTYNVPLPADAPNGQATFAWFWINRTGNRELYMNCADITIKGGKDNGSITGRKALVADLPGYSTFPEGFANDYGKDQFDAQPMLTISPSGNSAPVNPPAQSSSQAYPVETPSQTQPQPPVETTTSTSQPPVQTTATSVAPSSSETTQSQSQVPVYPTEVLPSSGYPTQPIPSKVTPPPSNGEKCQHGSLRCGTSGIEICSYGAFYSVGCPPTTSCKVVDGNPGCRF